MDSRFTYSDFQNAMARFNLSSAEFLRKINRYCEYILGSELYSDLFSIVRATTTTGYIPIPREFGRAYGAVCDTFAQPVYGRWVEFIEYGLGKQDPSQMNLLGLIDAGNDHCVQAEIWDGGSEVPGTLRFTINSATDAAKIIRVFGTDDTTGAEVFDPSDHNRGLKVTLVSPSVDTTQVFRHVSGIQCPTNADGTPTMVSSWTLSKVISGTPQLAGTYDRTETRPKYTWYKTGQLNQTWELYCKRKHCGVKDPGDWIYPDNINAAERGFSALNYADKGEYTKELDAWERAKDILKEEYAAAIPPIRMFMTSDDFGGRAPLTGGRSFWT